MRTRLQPGSAAGSGHWLNAFAIASSTSGRIVQNEEFQMSDRIESRSDEHIDRFIRGELSPAEQRALAQKSLDDAELFERITSAAVVKATLEKPSLRKRLQPQKSSASPIPFHRRARLWAVVTVAAVAATVVVLVSVPKLRQNRPSLTDNSRDAVA